MKTNLTIVIAPNEDGLGTSAWVVRLVKEMTHQGQEHISKIKVIVATERLERYHNQKYFNLSVPVEIVRLEAINSKIELVKNLGTVDVPRSIQQAILTYKKSRVEYENALNKKKVLKDANIVINLGVPQLVRAVYRHNLIRKSDDKIKCVTFFDHAWSLSLRKIIFSDETRGALAQSVEDALIDIENDEGLTQEAIIFPEPISPIDYHGYWRKLIGNFPQVIQGSLGGPICTLECVDDSKFAQFRSQIEKDRRCPKEAYNRARQITREILGISNNNPTLFISGGATPVCDNVLKTMIDDYESNEPNYNVVVYNPSEAKRRGIDKKFVPQRNITETCRLNEKLIFINHSICDAQHVLFPAFDLVLTRAGGGTVNDALACGVPLVIVEEPGMWQVEQIRQSCENMNIAEIVSFNVFKELPRHCVQSQDGKLKKLEDKRKNILQFQNHSEIWLVRELLKM